MIGQTNKQTPKLTHKHKVLLYMYKLPDETGLADLLLELELELLVCRLEQAVANCFGRRNL